MSAGSNSSGSHKNSLAERHERAAGRDPTREKGDVGGAFGVQGHPNRRVSTKAGTKGSDRGSTSKSDYSVVGTSHRKARKAK